MSLQSNGVAPNLPAVQSVQSAQTVQPVPVPLPAQPGQAANPRASTAQERAAARQSGQTARGSGGTSSAGTTARGESSSLVEADRGRVGGDDGEHSEGAQEGGLVAGFDRVEGRSRSSNDGRRSQSDLAHDSGGSEHGITSQVTSQDVRGIFSASGRNSDEDLVKELVRKLDMVQGNRIKRKFELILNMAQAGAKQDRSWLAMCEQAMRDVDTQFDELERGLQQKLREAKQAVAARQVSAGATAAYLIVAADQHDRRQARQRLERQRDAIRQMVIKASSAPGALNVMPLLGLLQALCVDAEQAIERQGEYLPSRGEVQSAAELEAIEAQRARTNQMLGDAWRQASELNSAAMAGMYSELRHSVEHRFTQQRDRVNSV